MPGLFSELWAEIDVDQRQSRFLLLGLALFRLLHQSQVLAEHLELVEPACCMCCFSNAITRQQC